MHGPYSSGAIIAAALLLSMPLALSAQEAPIPKTFVADDTGQAAAAGSPDATSSASVPAPNPRFLGFESKESFHRFSGWMAGGTLLAAGIVGAVHAYGMMSTAHAYRDSLGIEEFSATTCDPEIASVWNDPTQQALRWTPVGLLAVGESFYLANAFTGASFMAPLGPGWSKAKIHRYAFFVHAGLMVAEGVMGYFSSQALSSGDHGTFHGLLVAHAALGFAIPVVILGAGVVMDPKINL
jgi:hypothetical protein